MGDVDSKMNDLNDFKIEKIVEHDGVVFHFSEAEGVKILSFSFDSNPPQNTKETINEVVQKRVNPAMQWAAQEGFFDKFFGEKDGDSNISFIYAPGLNKTENKNAS